MKMKFTPFVILLLFLFSAHAQSPIKLTQTDMPAIGFSETYAIDTPLTSVNYGSAGANQVYNFSNLTSSNAQTISYVALTGPQQSAFPTANLALTTDNSNFVMLKNTVTKFQAVGLQGHQYGLLVNTPISPVEDLYHFPTQYLGSYYGNWGFYQGFTGQQVGGQASNADSVRIVYTDNFSDVVDGWGKVITPTGAYKALRVKRIDTTVTNIDAKYPLTIFSSSTWNNQSSITNITTEYTYLAKETKGAVVSFTYDSAGNMKDAKYSLIPPAPPVAHFTFVTGAAGLVTFTDSTDGYPTRYHWSFGDGDTANTINPIHTYAANGTYYVCETVYNAGGSNTYCDSVHVTSVAVHVRPVANNDSATVHQPNSTTVNVTANDYSPSSDAFCVTAVYGGTYFSVLNCNTVAFNPAAGYSGYDTAHYIICNTGQPTLCDTALVVVHVIATATHLPPLGVNDTVTILQPNSGTINVTANDRSPSADSFCITRVYGSTYFSVLNCNDLAFNPDSTFTGNDTAYYIECNTGQPTLCDTASVIVTVQQNPALWPVANFSLQQVNCGGLVGINQSLNADSIVWNFHTFAGVSYPDSVFYQVNNVQLGQGPGGTDFQVCVTSFNKFGSSEKCDSMLTICEGINEVQLSGIRMYPNPANSRLSIDMRDNTDAVTKNYSAIEIYNAIGQKIKTVNRNGNADVLSIAVDGFPSGIYLATIVDSKGATSTLGKFTVMQ